MKGFFTLLLLITAFATVKAQDITGTINTDNESPLPKATVSLLQVKDSVQVATVATDDKGHYKFANTNNGDYLLKVSAIGHVTTLSPAFTASEKNHIVAPIKLQKTNTVLSGVTVTAKRPPVEVKAGKTVVNVDASPTNAGLNVLEILEKSPGVSVDNDGNVSLKGKSGVLILIDGKPTYLSGQNLAAFLKSIQAGGLDQIEIMTNPPAKYDAAGNGGVINIKTKKGAVKGMNGNMNLNYAQGFYPKYNGGVNFNYRNNKLNLFGSYNGGVWEGTGILKINRNFYQNSTLSGSSDQLTDRHNKSSWHNGKLGMDYYFSKRDVAGIVLTGNINPWKNWQNSVSNLRDVNGDINTVLRSDAYNANTSKNINTNINYKHSFDSAGREISVDLDQGYYQSRGNNFLTTRVYNADQSQRGHTVLLQGLYPSVVKIYSAKADYVHPFNKTTKLEAGIKSSFVNTDNNVDYKRDTSTGWQQDMQRSNHFIYRENINAAYAILSTSIKKWEFTAGLRLENTNAKGTQVKSDSSFTKNYTNLFPNAGVVYNVNDKNQLSAAYSRRIRRPDYEDLNPFIFFLDSLTYGQGNPYLQPEFSNRFELSHTYNRFLTTTVSHTETNNIITQILKQNTEKKTTFQTRENFSRMSQWGASVSLNKELKSWWNISLYSGVFYNRYKGLYSNGTDNIPVALNVTMFDGNISNSFKFAKTWTTEISGWYNSSPSEGLMIGRSLGALNAALAKQILKKNGTIKLGVRDIFRTQNFSGYSRYADVDINVSNDRKKDNRQFLISFTYKFGKNNGGSERRRTGGANDEQSRVKNGGN